MRHITIETSLGEISAELFADQAPLTTKFFLECINSGFYKGGHLYRSTRLGIENGPFLIQGGAALPYLENPAAGKPAPLLKQLESTGKTGLKHQRGTLSLARDLQKTGHVLAEFFICLGDFPSLNEGSKNLIDSQGYPAFGEVRLGLDILDQIAAQETHGETHVSILEGQMLSSPIDIHRILAG